MSDWEMQGNGEVHDLMSEAEVIAGIVLGQVSVEAVVRPVGKEKWKPLVAHAPFALALQQRAAAQAPPQQHWQPPPQWHQPPQAYAHPPQAPPGKFLDPGANARSCLTCVGVVFLGVVGLFVLGLLSRC